MTNRLLAYDEPASYFHAQELGASFLEFSADVVETGSKKVVCRWFHSAKDMDLFVWMDIKGRVIKQQMTFFGQVVQWNLLEGIKTGCTLEEEGLQEKIYFDKIPQKSASLQAVEILKHIEGLNHQSKDQLIYNFTNNPHVDDMDPEVFVRDYGHFASSQSSKEAWGLKIFRRMVYFLRWLWERPF